jgi:membrane fusion protein (multidrug efflux system)
MGFLIAAMIIFTAARSTSTSAAIPPVPPEIGVARVVQKDVPIYREWIGTLDGMVNAAIKAQVSGYVLMPNYTEGSVVKIGQVVFAIDARWAPGRR